MVAPARTKRVAIKSAKELGEFYDKDQVIVLSWDKITNTTWVTTWSKTILDCEQAAIGGEKIKNYLGLVDITSEELKSN